MIQPPSLASHVGFTYTPLVRPGARAYRVAFEMLIRQHNRMLFRLARVILQDDSEAEAALQEAYVAAYSTLKTSGDDSSLSIRLIRIVIDESLGRLNRVVIGCNVARGDERAGRE